jgi:hypothetical protein
MSKIISVVFIFKGINEFLAVGCIRTSQLHVHKVFANCYTCTKRTLHDSLFPAETVRHVYHLQIRRQSLEDCFVPRDDATFNICPPIVKTMQYNLLASKFNLRL